MTLSIYFDTGRAEDLSTTTGWGDICRWAETLSAKHYAEIKHLTLYGWTEELMTLETQLTEALKHDAPDADDVNDTVKNLLSIVEERKSKEKVVVVSDGVGINEDDSVKSIERKSNDAVQPPKVEIDAAKEKWRELAPKPAKDLIDAKRID